MKTQEVRAAIGPVPHMTLKQAETITKVIADNHVESILELGFKHGVSTCYMAAALSELGRGSIVTIDLEWTRGAEPTIEELLGRIGERHRVEVFYEPTSYTWRLMKILEVDPAPRFDLCYLDGAHTWFVDALAFFLVDRLLLPGGWIILDDVNWTFATSPTLKDRETTRLMPLEERTTPQVRKIYELLVKPHPGYHHFRLEDGWAFAQKRETSRTSAEQRETVTEQVVRTVHVGLGAFLMKVVNRIGRK